jgi:hypothetical protein
MSLLRSKHERRRSGRRIREYITLPCPRYGHRITWCRQMCTPTGNLGDCGRLAPHAMVGKTQAAIAAYKKSHPSG